MFGIASIEESSAHVQDKASRTEYILCVRSRGVVKIRLGARRSEICVVDETSKG